MSLHFFLSFLRQGSVFRRCAFFWVSFERGGRGVERRGQKGSKGWSAVVTAARCNLGGRWILSVSLSLSGGRGGRRDEMARSGAGCRGGVGKIFSFQSGDGKKKGRESARQCGGRRKKKGGKSVGRRMLSASGLARLLQRRTDKTRGKKDTEPGKKKGGTRGGAQGRRARSSLPRAEEKPTPRRGGLGKKKTAGHTAAVRSFSFSAGGKGALFRALREARAGGVHAGGGCCSLAFFCGAPGNAGESSLSLALSSEMGRGGDGGKMRGDAGARRGGWGGSKADRGWFFCCRACFFRRRLLCGKTDNRRAAEKEKKRSGVLLRCGWCRAKQSLERGGGVRAMTSERGGEGGRGSTGPLPPPPRRRPTPGAATNECAASFSSAVGFGPSLSRAGVESRAGKKTATLHLSIYLPHPCSRYSLRLSNDDCHPPGGWRHAGVGEPQGFHALFVGW